MLTRSVRNVWKLNYRSLSSTQLEGETIQEFRTSINSPSHHGIGNCGQFYTLSPDVCKTLFKYGGIPKSFQEQTKTFTETCVMIRNPVLEIKSLIEKSDFSKPVNRFVIYGTAGSGKTLSLLHLVHYAHENNFLLVHIPWVPEWIRRTLFTKEIVASTTREGLIDLPIDAANWLIHFKLQNQTLLKPDLVTSNEYVWSKREIMPVGTTLMELIDIGINRVKYASDVVVALLQEIKILSIQKKCKTFVAIDGFNSFYTPTSQQKLNGKYIAAQDFTLTQAFLDMTKNDWCNGAIVMTVDSLAVLHKRDGYLPHYLLEKQGFQHLDPFIPIEVSNYTHKEYLSCMKYYRDRLWVRDHPEAEVELETISAKHPYTLMRYCAPL